MNFSVIKNGETLDNRLYSWDEETRIFSSEETNLIIYFSKINNITFRTGSDCTFYTGFNCTFKTDSYCTFYTGSDCTFKTGFYCNFYTGSDCTFDTESNCTFDTESNCTFDTGANCTFKTGSNCTFKTGSNSVVVRRDVFEVINLPLLKKGNYIKLNNKGCKIKHIITIDGKDIELSEQSYNSLKEQLK